MGVRAPLAKIASLCLSIEASLLLLQNTFAWSHIFVVQFNICEKLHGDFRAILNKGESLSTV